MTWPPCGARTCPVAEPNRQRLRRVRTTTVDTRRRWWRGLANDRRPATLTPALGDTRFAPLPATAHAYIGATRTVALLESSLHEASGRDPTIYLVRLERQVLAPVRLRTELRVADLRDTELARLGIARHQLVDTTPMHYPCTRRWALELQHRRPGGGSPVAGILWHSRQADLHARANPGWLFADVVVHAPTEVAVVWEPPAPRASLRRTGALEPLVVDGRPTRLVVELSALIGAPIE